MTLFKKIAILAVAVGALSLPAVAAHHLNTSTGMLLEGGPLALRGYDPVSYFTQAKAVVGSHEFAAVHDGAV